MTTTHLILYCLWLTPHALQALILITLFRKKLFSQFPIFTTYTAYSICNFIVLFFNTRSASAHSSYFHWYAFGLGVGTVLRFGVIGEAFTCLLWNFAVLRHLQKPLLRCLTIGLVLVSLGLAIYTQRDSAADLKWFVVFVLNRTANTVQCGLLLFLFLFAAYLKVSWPKPVFGIALGLGVLSSVEMATTAIRTQVGDSWPVILDLVTMSAYLCCVIIWLYYLLVPEPDPAHIIDKIPDGDLEAWNQELEQLLHQ